MELLPIHATAEENEVFINNPLCHETIYQTIAFFNRVGYQKPWIGYYALQDGMIVGACAFKGAPIKGVVEIAYGTMEQHRNKGVSTEMCRLLVRLALETDPLVVITARTLPEKNFSTRILEKNDFVLSGVVNDPEDGEVWEWIFQKSVL